MENEPIRDRLLREAMESCRPGHDDLGDPEMASLAHELEVSPELAGLHRRLQRLDAAIADAFRDVPVPAGLEARILSRLQAVPSEADSPASEVVPAISARQRESRSIVRGPWVLRRRWFLFAGSLAAAAAAVFLMVLGTLRKPNDFTTRDVLELAEQFYLNDTHGGGQVLGKTAVRSDYPFSRNLMSVMSGRFPEIRWRPIAGFLNRRAVAFDVVGPQGTVATLYVAECSVDGLPAEVPVRPMLSTGETSVSAWQEGELLYVLVVDGGIPAYDRFLAASEGPLA
jgi:hypothetical protein